MQYKVTDKRHEEYGPNHTFNPTSKSHARAYNYTVATRKGSCHYEPCCPAHIVTSTKEITFLRDFVCLFVCLSVCLSVC